jgi:peptidyl-prolyl cis-trans isomerase C
MAPEFDRVVFSEEVGKVHGPVKTQFGYHLIEITSRQVK